MKLYNFENSESHILTAVTTHVLWPTNRNAAMKDALIVWHQQSEHFGHNSDKQAKKLSTCPHSSPISLLLSCLNAHKCYDSKSLVRLNLHHFASPLWDRWATYGSKSFILFWNDKAIYALKLIVQLLKFSWPNSGARILRSKICHVYFGCCSNLDNSDAKVRCWSQPNIQPIRLCSTGHMP